MLPAVHAALLVSLSMALGAQPVVLLSPEDRSLILGPIVQSVQAQLADLPVELRVQPVQRLEGFLGAQMKVARQAAGAESLAVIWLELSPGDPVFVYVADPQRNRVLARSVDWDGALGHLEAVGLIVRTSVQALLAGQQIGFEAPGGPRPAGPEQAPPQAVPVPKGEQLFHLGFKVGYAPSTPGGEAPMLHGLDASVFAGLGAHLLISGGYRVIPAFLERANPYSLALVSRHPFWLGVGGRLTFGRLQLGAEAACNVDLVNLEMKDVGPWIRLSPPHQQVIVSFAPSVSLAVTLIAPLSVYVEGGVDVPLNERHYFTEGPAGRAVVLTPWQVQPRAAVGLRVEVL